MCVYTLRMFFHISWRPYTGKRNLSWTIFWVCTYSPQRRRWDCSLDVSWLIWWEEDDLKSVKAKSILFPTTVRTRWGRCRGFWESRQYARKGFFLSPGRRQILWMCSDLLSLSCLENFLGKDVDLSEIYSTLSVSAGHAYLSIYLSTCSEWQSACLSLLENLTTPFF